jgi:hypothetical protein
MFKGLAVAVIFAFAISGIAFARNSGGQSARDAGSSHSTMDRGAMCFHTVNGAKKWHHCHA